MDAANRLFYEQGFERASFAAMPEGSCNLPLNTGGGTPSFLLRSHSVPVPRETSEHLTEQRQPLDARRTPVLTRV